MATYNPKRKTNANGTTESVQFPISAINGLQTALNGKAESSHTQSYLPLSGGTLTGNLTGRYITGTWLQSTADNALSYAPPRICVQDSGGWIYSRTPAQILDDIGATAALNEKLSKAGGTLTGTLTITNSSSEQKNEPSLKWKKVGENTPYVGFATDQTDGTFLFGSLKGTNYQAGLAIGGGSGNLLWKGARVVTANEIGAAASKGVDTSVKSGSANLVTSGAVYTAIASAITTALNTGV